MSDWTDGGSVSMGIYDPALAEGAVHEIPIPQAAQYAASFGLVAAATIIGLSVRPLISSQLALVFVPPVVISAAAFNWAPTLAAVIASVLAFDFFFTEPYYSLAIANQSDIWAATLLLITALIVSAVAAKARLRAVESRRAAVQARALQSLAHAIVQGRKGDQIAVAAAEALHRIFEAPVLIFMDGDIGLRLAAAAGGAKATLAETHAAEGALRAGVRTRGEIYPHDRTEFDFWPLATRSGGRCALGVNFKRSKLGLPDDPERVVDVVQGYLAAAIAR
jgi:K+-sensing histidine kinase KdpD